MSFAAMHLRFEKNSTAERQRLLDTFRAVSGILQPFWDLPDGRVDFFVRDESTALADLQRRGLSPERGHILMAR